MMPEVEAGSFDELLRRYRLAAGLTQEDLAERAGLSIRAVSDLERGINRAPHRETVALLAGALDLTPEVRAAFIAAVPRRVRGARPAPLGLPPPPVSSPAAPSSHAAPTLPPLPPTAMIGRDGEFATLRNMLQDPAVRLLTLSGPPGVGKTHLALRLAHDLAGRFADGALFVPLEALSGHETVLPAIAAALRLSDPGTSSAALELALGSRELLLVLDNFEHVLAAAPAVARLVQAAPGLTVLVTSQARLRLRGARSHQVRPLSYPDGDGPLAVDQLAIYPAVALFLARARESDPTFVLTPAQASAVIGICRRLDGLPLAIELAAARSAVLTPTMLLPRLERSLALLSAGPLDLPARQQTIRSALAWSYDLLAPAEQQLFRALSVFAGGCTLAAAVVAGGQDAGEVELLDGLGALCEKSLLQRQANNGGAERFVMLAVLHEYACEQLQAQGETGAIELRHALYFRDLAVSAAAGLWGDEPEAWPARLAPEAANFRAALNWSLAAAPVAVALPLVAALGELWRVSGQWGEGRAWAERVLAAAIDASASREYAAALQSAGELAFYQGDLPIAADHLSASVALWRTLGQDDGLARALSTLAWVRLAQGASDEAQALADSGFTLAQQHGTASGRAWALHIKGHVARNRGAHEAATAAFAASQALWQALNHARDSAWALLNLGEVARGQADYGQARLLYEAGRQRFAALDDAAGIVWAERNLGFVALAQDDAPAAASQFAAALRRYEQLGNRRGIAVSLVGQAGAALALGRAELAAQLLAAAADLLARLGVRLDATDLRVYEQLHNRVRENLAAPTWEAAQFAGRAWSLNEALAAATAVATPTS